MVVCYDGQMITQPFSQRLSKWLSSDRPKTLQGLTDSFSEKSFAILFLILLAIPALPIPTGGVSHLFEAVAMLLALELMAGRREVWLPKKWRRLKLGPRMRTKALPRLIKIIRWLEKYSRPRLRYLLNNGLAFRLIGALVLIFCIFAFIAPPFSGLDTLPALGIVVISLAMILDDFVVFLAGVVAGLTGISLVVLLGGAILKSFHLL